MGRTHTMIRARSGVDSIDHYEIEGDIVEENASYMILEKTNIRQLDVDGKHTQSAVSKIGEHNKNYAVVLRKGVDNKATFFDDLEQARIFIEKWK